MTIVSAAVSSFANPFTGSNALSGLIAFGSRGFTALFAAAESGPLGSLAQHLIAVVIYAALGIVVFGLGIFLFVKLCPFSVRKEIEEDQNTSLAIIMGAVLLGLSIIIAAAIQG